MSSTSPVMVRFAVRASLFYSHLTPSKKMYTLSSTVDIERESYVAAQNLSPVGTVTKTMLYGMLLNVRLKHQDDEVVIQRVILKADHSGYSAKLYPSRFEDLSNAIR
jgi:hypothetical protein